MISTAVPARSRRASQRMFTLAMRMRRANAAVPSGSGRLAPARPWIAIRPGPRRQRLTAPGSPAVTRHTTTRRPWRLVPARSSAPCSASPGACPTTSAATSPTSFRSSRSSPAATARSACWRARHSPDRTADRCNAYLRARGTNPHRRGCRPRRPADRGVRGTPDELAGITLCLRRLHRRLQHLRATSDQLAAVAKPQRASDRSQPGRCACHDASDGAELNQSRVRRQSA